MMRIVVTGGVGKLGALLVQELSARHDVTIYDRIECTPHQTTVHVQGDCLDRGALSNVLKIQDAVVHLAAITHPEFSSPADVFHSNVCGTYNVVDAAVEAKVGTVVFASSINVLGFGYSEHPPAPLYLPVDERHPVLPQDAYSLSKLVGEEIVLAAHRRSGVRAVCLRPAWMVAAGELVSTGRLDRPEEHAWCLWSYIDFQDAARGFCAAVEREDVRCEVLFLAAKDSLAPEPLCEFIPRCYPGMEQHARGLTGCDAGISGERAQEVLDFTPARSWRCKASSPPAGA